MYYGELENSQLPLRFGLGLVLKGMPISLGFWEWGFPKRGDAHITVTPLALAEKLATLSPGRFSTAPRRRSVQSETLYSVLKLHCKDSREEIFSRQC